MIKKVLGVKIDDINMDDAVSMVDGWLSQKGKHYIVTPNPEFVMTARIDNQFQMILNRADLSIPDGSGLRLGGIKNIVPGVDFMERLVKLANDKAYTIGLFGGRNRVANKTAECLLKKYPKLKISFTSSGGNIDGSGKFSLRSNNNIPNTDILFIAFGHPKQEYWIAQNLDKLPVKVAMGVGGAFDYISGSVPRAPGWMRTLGLEWLFRLLLQPWRIKRQLALLKYFWLIILRSGLAGEKS